MIFADPPGFIDPDVEVLGGVHPGKGLVYGNGGLPAVPDGAGDERRAVGDVARRVEAGDRRAEGDRIDGYEAARGAGHVHAFERRLVGLQAARADDQIRIQQQGIAGGEFRMQRAGFVKGERGYGPGLEAEASAFRGDGVAEVAVVDEDAFVMGLTDFLGGRAHGVGGFEADDMYGCGVEAAGCEGAVKGDPAAAEDDDGFSGKGLAFERGTLEPAYGGDKVFLAGDVEAAFLPQADGEDGCVIGVEQALQGDVAAHGDVGANLHAGGYYGPGFAVHHILGQPEVGHGMARHPAHDRRALVNGDGVPEQGGEAGGGEPGGAGTDYGDALAGGGQGNEAGFMPGIGGKPLQRMDGDGLVVFGPVAFGFARMRAHAPGDAGERVARVQPGEGLVGFSGGDQRVHLLDAVAEGAGMFAGRRAALTVIPAYLYGDPVPFLAVNRRHDAFLRIDRMLRRCV